MRNLKKKKPVHSREVHKYSPHPGLKASKMKTCALVISRVVILKTGFSLAFNHHCNITLHERKVKHLAAEGILYGQMVTFLSKPISDTRFCSRGNMNELSPQKEILHLLFFLFAQMIKNGKIPQCCSSISCLSSDTQCLLIQKKKKKCVVLLQFF